MSKNTANLVTKIRDDISIASVAERLGLSVVASGSNSKTFCPFNSHKRPTVELYDSQASATEPRHFHCFSCGAHGDAFDLVKQVKSTDFTGAVEWLAQTFGLEQGTAPRKKTSQKSQNKSVEQKDGLSRALEIYRKTADRNNALRWLERRALSPEMLDRAELFLASPRTLSTFLKSSNISDAERRILEDQLESSGLIRRDRPLSEGASDYLDLKIAYRDFFYDERIIFPIRTKNNILVGFAGRLVGSPKSDNVPKYLYTPQLPKGNILYRADSAFGKIASKDPSAGQYRDLVICEGLVDALRLESLGFNAVALLGSQMSTGQFDLIVELARNLPMDKSLRCFIFLDCDHAGQRGSAKLIAGLIERDIQPVFVWPGTAHGKDPDEILKEKTPEQARECFLGWSYPPVVSVLADSLGVPPTDIVEDQKWSEISISRRYQAARGLAKSRVDEDYLFYTPPDSNNFQKENAWRRDVLEYRDVKRQSDENIKYALSKTFLEDSTARLNHARALAKAGAQRGELPSDEAAWQRINIAATAFNESFKARLRENLYIPLEPFDAVLVSRGFGKAEARLKAMPCAEDLVVQQYILNELLTERLDSVGNDVPFSRHIPAVRYYRSAKKTITTAENLAGGEQTETLSFAYQIDMDVLEGNRPATDQGMFRPFFECWREFNFSLQRQSRNMPAVHMVRLDLKRYYDNLARSTIRDSLKTPLRNAFKKIDEDSIQCAQLFETSSNRSDALVDWICDQSFGFHYYDPTDGKVVPKPGSEHVGIPQGPVLSAWLATLALFPLDAAMRKALETFNSNSDGVIRAGYARYVDDVVLLADSQEILSVLRATAEDAIRKLQLEISQKGERIPPLPPEEFSKLLTAGKAIVGSGPTWEPAVMSFENRDNPSSWDAPETTRAVSLLLLSDPLLYASDSNKFNDNIYTAFNASDLRPGDIAKIASKLWYWVSLTSEKNEKANKVWEKYWTRWGELTRSVSWSLDAERCAWDDPVFYALDGLEALIKTSKFRPAGLNDRQEINRLQCVSKLAEIALSVEFVTNLISPNLEFAPTGAGKGVAKLSRMFWQRCLTLRWKMIDLQRKKKNQIFAPVLDSLLDNLSNTQRGSLVRAYIAEMESTSFPVVAMALAGEAYNQVSLLRPSIIWLHQAIALFNTEKGASHRDPLFDIASDFTANIFPIAVEKFESEMEKVFIYLLQYLLPDELISSADTLGRSNNDLIQHAKALALATLTAISQREKLLSNLASRQSLIKLGSSGRIQPSLPGVKSDALLLIRPLSDREADKNIWEIDALRSISVPESTSSAVSRPPNEVDEARPDGTVVGVHIDWNENSNSGSILKIFDGKWNGSSKSIYISPPSVNRIDATTLKFAAATFDALARINDALAKRSGGKLEYAPAWPYIAVSADYEDIAAKTLINSNHQSYTLVCVPVKQEYLGNLAFIRDGARGLVTVQIPGGENAWYWRIGYALTDLLGLTNDLDHSAVEINDQDHETTTSPFEPVKYMLRAMLQRLRGKYANRIYQRSEVLPYLPITLERCLSILRSYPESDESQTGICYVLAVDWENRAMAYRMENGCAFEGRGESSYFLEKTLANVFKALPVSWADALPPQIHFPSNSYRRTVSAWVALNDRVGQLDAYLPESSSDEPLLSAWLTFRSAVRLSAVVGWLKALAFEMEGQDNDVPFSTIDVDIANIWGIESATLVIGERDENLFELFDNSIKSSRVFYDQIDKITPLGWLTLVAKKAGIFSESMMIGRKFSDDFNKKICSLAIGLAPITLPDAGKEKWPFESCVVHAENSWSDVFLTESLLTLSELDSHLNISVSLVDHNNWGYDPTNNRFVDSNGSQWHVEPWRITQVFRDKHIEEYKLGRQFRKIWTETRNGKNELIGIDVLGGNFAKFVPILRTETETPVARISAELEAEVVAPVSIVERNVLESEIAGETAVVKQQPAAEPQHKYSDAHIVPETERVQPPHAEGQADPKKAESATDYVPPPLSSLRDWQALQAHAWAPRKTKASSHIRVALLQIRVDDSYRHPIVEAGMPVDLEDALDGAGKELRKEQRESILSEGAPAENVTISPLELARALGQDCGDEWKWTAAHTLPSWAEHRRRRVLVEAIRSCESFAVDILVLPEYSLRPDTIAWLKKFLELKQAKVSVVAGTYRIHGNPGEGDFNSRFAEIFGESDGKKMFGQHGALPSEKSSFITLLAPLQIPRLGHTVGIFTRPKKYSAVAMSEVFRPGVDIWEPLFTFDKLLGYIEYAKKNVDGQPEVLSAKELVQLFNIFLPVRSIAELICSELFLPTNPANWPSIASEYKKMLEHFGMRKGAKDAYQSVRDDLNSLAMAMSPAGFSMDGEDHHCIFPRRSILIVPALTSRSADYWIHGQSALLSAGVTTVFCTGSGHGLSGGSCIIGRKSWDHKMGESAGMHDHVTPYGGWSRGIYYNRPEDALGADEQAMVIADIDPLYMLEGKPRPQVLPVPLQLVAHLPILETVDIKALIEHTSKWTSTDLKACSVPLSLPHLTARHKVAKLTDALGEKKELAISEASALGLLFSGGKKDNVFARRLEHWKRYHRDAPSVMPSPAIVDWIWVDQTPVDGPVADIFMPPFRNKI
jgi:DNA primase catalytic core